MIDDDLRDILISFISKVADSIADQTGIIKLSDYGGKLSNIIADELGVKVVAEEIKDCVDISQLLHLTKSVF